MADNHVINLSARAKDHCGSGVPPRFRATHRDCIAAGRRSHRQAPVEAAGAGDPPKPPQFIKNTIKSIEYINLTLNPLNLKLHVINLSASIFMRSLVLAITLVPLG